MIDLSSSTEPRLAAASHVLSAVAAVAEPLGVPVMVIGATARDILAESIVGAPAARATADIDVAVAVRTWRAFADLTSGLERIGRRRHTFAVTGFDVDVIPFGDVETDGRVIDWGDGTRMNALGLTEAHARSLPAILPGGTQVRVPSVAGLTVLKLSAWSDRRIETRRDAVDLHEIIRWYSTGAFLDELYDTEVALLTAYDFNPDAAGAHRLGQHMAELLGATTSALLTILDDDGLARLVADMPATVGDQAAVLRALRNGLQGR